MEGPGAVSHPLAARLGHSPDTVSFVHINEAQQHVYATLFDVTRINEHYELWLTLLGVWVSLLYKDRVGVK